MTKPSWGMGSARAVFPYLVKKFGIKTFVETGTGFGDTLIFMSHACERCYSIEARDWNYRLSSACFAHVPNCKLIFGESKDELPRLLRSIPNEPTFFWLDAHMEIGAHDPLAEEIRCIVEQRPNALIAIDDVGENTHHDPYLRSDGGVPIGWTRDYRFGRILFLHRGQYDIDTDL